MAGLLALRAVYHVATNSHAVKIYLEKSCLGEIPPGPRAGTQGVLLMAQGLHEVYVQSETDLWGFNQGPGGTLLPYGQTSLHAMAGGVASDAVKAIYLQSTGFGSPHAFYASLQRSNAKLGTLHLHYCVLLPDGTEGPHVPYPGGLYVRCCAPPSPTQKGIWGQRHIRLDGGILALDARSATHKSVLKLCVSTVHTPPAFYKRKVRDIEMRFYIDRFEWTEDYEDALVDDV